MNDVSIHDAVNLRTIEQARERVRPHLFLTPCRRSTLLSRQTGADVYLKLDNLQITGSFKERGACNKLALLTQEERDRGVIAASAGNHAQAVAYHGARLGISTKIVMPEGTPLVKVTRTKNFGGEVVLHGSNFDESYLHAVELQREEGRTFVHPFDDPAIIQGQGTMGLELLEQVEDLEAVIVPIGGGGLAAGVAVAIKELRPDVQVIGAEPTVLPSMKTALKRGRVVELPEAQTLADGVSVRSVGKHTRELLARYVDDVVLVSEEAIANAILVLLEQEKTVAEGAGAAALAALLSGAAPLVGQRVALVVSGGNIDVNVISRVIEHGLVAAGRLHRVDLRIMDTPGSLADVLTLVGKLKANVLEVYHNRTFTSGEAFGTTHIELKLETRGSEHVDEIRDVLSDSGYTIIDRL